MKYRKHVLAAVFCCFGFGATNGLAQGIGSVLDANNAFGTPPQGSRTALALGSGVVSDEFVETGEQANAHIEFIDQTDLLMGANSLIILDELVYDPNTNFGDYVFRVAAGIARFVSGDINAENFIVRTDTAIIGIRGTNFVVQVSIDGTTIVSVFEGSVIITPLGGPPSLVRAGQSGTVTPEGTELPATVTNGILVDADPGIGELVVLTDSAPGGDTGNTGGGTDSGPPDSGRTDDGRPASEPVDSDEVELRGGQDIVPTIPIAPPPIRQPPIHNHF